MKINSIKGRKIIINKTGPTLLAVGQQIETDLLLGSDVETCRKEHPLLFFHLSFGQLGLLRHLFCSPSADRFRDVSQIHGTITLVSILSLTREIVGVFLPRPICDRT